MCCFGASHRAFLRHFQGEHVRPKEWLRLERVRAAQALIKQSPHNLNWGANRVGFGSAQAMRVAFRSVLGVSPSTHR